jgi:hypothetical protein
MYPAGRPEFSAFRFVVLNMPPLVPAERYQDFVGSIACARALPPAIWPDACPDVNASPNYFRSHSKDDQEDQTELNRCLAFMAEMLRSVGHEIPSILGGRNARSFVTAISDIEIGQAGILRVGDVCRGDPNVRLIGDSPRLAAGRSE